MQGRCAGFSFSNPLLCLAGTPDAASDPLNRADLMHGWLSKLWSLVGSLL